jgi:hypothetical protein
MSAKRIHNRWFIAAPLVGIGLGMQGCSTTETEAACVWIHTPDECPPPGEAGDEVNGPEEGDQELPCIAVYDGTTRTLHQCHGGLTGRISFTALGKDCPQSLGSESDCQELHEFGSEPYELTRVMACCDPLVEESDVDEYLISCAADLAQQICTSMSMRIEDMINDGTIPKTAESTAMQKWIATHQKDCFESLWIDNTATEPGELAGSWSIPNQLAWQAVIKDFKLTIETAAVSDVSLPQDPADYVDCTDSKHNDTEIFESMVPWSPGITRGFALASEAPATLSGPVLMGGPVRATEFLTSRSNQCANPWCSTSRITVDARSGSWALEDMNLFVNGAPRLGNGNAQLEIERASVRLYHTSTGRVSADARSTLTYEIQPRQAHFIATGASMAGMGIYLLSNASPIIAHQTSTGWVFDGFVLDHVDAQGNSWVLTLPPMAWN